MQTIMDAFAKQSDAKRQGGSGGARGAGAGAAAAKAVLEAPAHPHLVPEVFLEEALKIHEVRTVDCVV